MKLYRIFKEYIWLLNTIYKAKRITLREINEKWQKTEMSGGMSIPRTTFNRHRDDILDIFGVYIECDPKDGFRYYIGNAHDRDKQVSEVSEAASLSSITSPSSESISECIGELSLSAICSIF